MVNQGVALSPAVKKAQIALTVIGLSGIVLPFVPFVYDVIPIDLLLEEFDEPFYWLLVAPCAFLPFPISAGYVMWLITGRLPRWASLLGLGLSAWFAISILAGLALSANEGWIPWVLLFIAVFAGGVWLRAWGIPHDSLVRELVLMQSIYVAPMTFWFTFALAEHGMRIGAALGAVTLLAYLVQITLAAKTYVFALAVAVPVVGLAIFSLVFD